MLCPENTKWGITPKNHNCSATSPRCDRVCVAIRPWSHTLSFSKRPREVKTASTPRWPAITRFRPCNVKVRTSINSPRHGVVLHTTEQGAPTRTVGLRKYRLEGQHSSAATHRAFVRLLPKWSPQQSQKRRWDMNHPLTLVLVGLPYSTALLERPLVA